MQNINVFTPRKPAIEILRDKGITLPVYAIKNDDGSTIAATVPED